MMRTLREDIAKEEEHMRREESAELARMALGRPVTCDDAGGGASREKERNLQNI